MRLSTFSQIEEVVRAELADRYDAREAALARSREIIRTCACVIRAAHRLELDRAETLLSDVETGLDSLVRTTELHPELAGAGYVHDCRKEYVEACVFLAVLRGEPIPAPQDLLVDAVAYLHGLAESVGEMRRQVLDRIRSGEMVRAAGLLVLMDEIYALLTTMDYPDGFTSGLRRATDVVRGIIEKTRGELTVAAREEELRAALRRLMERLDAQSPAAENDDG